MKWLMLVVGLLTLIFVEILRVYFIMPFPGSQKSETIEAAYFIHNHIALIRILGFLVIAYPVYFFFKNGKIVMKVTLAVVLGFYFVVFYMFNYRYLADKMFLLPTKVEFLDAQSNKKIQPTQLVVGVTIDGESKAYPIEIIGYHHQVRDVVGGKQVMITYCTVCRTGRAFSPSVDGKEETFRLVGMDHFNAMFEDSQTKSWWRQVNGEAIVGPLKGKMLPEIPSEQMTLAAWLEEHPDGRVMQPDSVFAEAYKGLATYDEGNKKGTLTVKDSVSWREKSWIVGVQIGMDAKAFDWIELQKVRTINDEVGGIPVLVAANSDSISFHVFNRIVGSDTLVFSLTNSATNLMDTKTMSLWNWQGQCISGPLQGNRLTPVQSYQEYWHSWRTFRPQTTRYSMDGSTAKL